MTGGPETPLATGQLPPDMQPPVAPADMPVQEQVDLGWDPESEMDSNAGMEFNDGMNMGIRKSTLSGEQPFNVLAPLTPQQPLGDINADPNADPAADMPSGMDRGPRTTGPGRQVKVGAPRFNQNYRYTQEDFYGQQHPISFTDPRGVQMHVPEAGRLPMAIAASRMQQNQRDLAEVKKAKQNLLKSFEVKPTADPYQQSFQKLISEAQQAHIASIAEQYGGNTDLALEEIVSDPQALMEWENLHKELEAVSVRGKYSFDQANDYITRAATGNYQVDPKTLQRAKEVMNGFGNLRGSDGLPSMRALLNVTDAFDRDILREKWINDQIAPNIKDFYQRFSDFKTSRQGGMNLVATTDHEKLSEEFYREVAKSMTPVIHGSTVEENIKALKNFFPPEQLKTTVSARNIPVPGGGTSGDAQKLKDSAYNVLYRSIPVGAQSKQVTTTVTDPKTGKTREVVTTKEGTPTGQEFPTLQLFDIRSGQGQTPMAREFNHKGSRITDPKTGKVVDDNKTGTTWAHPTGIMNVGGKLFIIAKETGAPRTSATGGASGGGEDDEEVPIQEFNSLKDIILPYEGNETVIETSFPWINDGGIKNALQWNGGKTQKNARQQSPSFATDSPKTTSVSTIKSMVGKPGYEGYSEQELMDYYKSQGYTIQ